MSKDERSSIEASERVSNAVVEAMAPLIEKLGGEAGKEGLVLLSTSMITAGASLLRECLGDHKTGEFISQIKNELKLDSPDDYQTY
jgi:hypothetical protein